jgi:regulator of sirC expression with transglutaminase-like and TPR domain
MHSRFQPGPQFAALSSGQTEIDLVELLLEYSADAYPAFDPTASRQELSRLGQAACEQIQASAALHPREHLVAVSRLLYKTEGFHGNEAEYYDPKNSYLNEVLTRKSGIPISLGIVYMAVARAAGLQLYGVPTPAHFMLGCDLDGHRFFVDPFSDGDVMLLNSCKHRIERRLAQPGALTDHDFRRASHREIGVRVLRNLKAAHLMSDHWAQTIPIQQRLVELLPEARDELRDLGLVLLRSGYANEALPLLDEYCDACSAEQLSAMQPYLRSCRRMAAELN